MALPLNAPGVATARGVELGQKIISGIEDLKIKKSRAKIETQQAKEFVAPESVKMRELTTQANIAEQTVKKLSLDAMIDLEQENPGLHKRMAQTGAMEKIQTALLSAETAENERRFNAINEFFAKQQFDQESWNQFRESQLEFDKDIPEDVNEGLISAFLMKTALRRTLPHQQALELASSKSTADKMQRGAVLLPTGEFVPSQTDATGAVKKWDFETSSFVPIEEGDKPISLPGLQQTGENAFTPALHTYAAKEIALNNEVIAALDNAIALHDNPTGLKSGLEQLGAGIAGQLRQFGAPEGAADAVEAVMTNNASAHDMSVAAAEYARITLAKSMSKSGRTFSALSYDKAGGVLGFGTIVDPQFTIQRMQMIKDIKHAENMRWVTDIGETGVAAVKQDNVPPSSKKVDRQIREVNGVRYVFENGLLVGTE